MEGTANMGTLHHYPSAVCITCMKSHFWQSVLLESILARVETAKLESIGQKQEIEPTRNVPNHRVASEYPQ